MSNLAVFYHCLFASANRKIDARFACDLMAAQMGALEKSRLADAGEIHIGVNGPDHDTASLFAPAGAILHAHGSMATTEIPTLALLRQWLSAHRDWYVCYHHMKGVTHPPFDAKWRWNMERHVIWSWRECVAALEAGYDACGCHWLTPRDHPNMVKSPFFGGNFWWARASYLLTLPPLPPPLWENRYLAETWIGSGQTAPKIRDYLPGWPSSHD